MEPTMNKHINLQDNIFILNSRLKILRDTLILDVDPSLFLEKTLDDIIFLDHALEVLLGQIRDNNRMFERNEVLDYFADLEWEFSRVLEEFSTGSGGVSAASFPAVQDRLRSLRDRGAERRRAVGDERQSTAAPPPEHTVSSDELNALLKDL
jgi:hypothetical protein